MPSERWGGGRGVTFAEFSVSPPSPRRKAHITQQGVLSVRGGDLPDLGGYPRTTSLLLLRGCSHLDYLKNYDII